jgi:hypothetical protein
LTRSKPRPRWCPLEETRARPAPGSPHHRHVRLVAAAHSGRMTGRRRTGSVDAAEQIDLAGGTGTPRLPAAPLHAPFRVTSPDGTFRRTRRAIQTISDAVGDIDSLASTASTFAQARQPLGPARERPGELRPTRDGGVQPLALAPVGGQRHRPHRLRSSQDAIPDPPRLLRPAPRPATPRHRRVAGSPGRRVAGSPGRRLASSPSRPEFPQDPHPHTAPWQHRPRMHRQGPQPTCPQPTPRPLRHQAGRPASTIRHLHHPPPPPSATSTIRRLDQPPPHSHPPPRPSATTPHAHSTR